MIMCNKNHFVSFADKCCDVHDSYTLFHKWTQIDKQQAQEEEEGKNSFIFRLKHELKRKWWNYKQLHLMRLYLGIKHKQFIYRNISSWYWIPMRSYCIQFTNCIVCANLISAMMRYQLTAFSTFSSQFSVFFENVHNALASAADALYTIRGI